MSAVGWLELGWLTTNHPITHAARGQKILRRFGQGRARSIVLRFVENHFKEHFSGVTFRRIIFGGMYLFTENRHIIHTYIDYKHILSIFMYPCMEAALR